VTPPLEAVPAELVVGERTLRYDLVVNPELGDPIGAHMAAGTWELSSALLWLLGCLAPGDAVLDLGAHFGSFTVPAASLGARITAVEGSIRNAAVLRSACHHNGLDNVHLVETVVAARCGPTEFVDLGPYGTVATKLIGSSTGYPTVMVEATRVDDLPGGPFEWAKVDVEGFETTLISGNPGTFRNLRGMAFESNGFMLHHHGSDPTTLVRTIEKAGMTVYEAYPGIIRPLHHPVLQPETVVDYIAVRGEPALPKGWTLSHGRGQEELLRRLDLESRHHLQEHRTYAARTIAGLGRRQRKDMARAIASR
jgi:FkbM family methyltransferase